MGLSQFQHLLLWGYFSFFFQFQIGTAKKLNVEHTIFNALSSKKHPCIITKHSYGLDLCEFGNLKDILIKNVGCVTPFGQYENAIICTDSNKSMNAINLTKYYFDDAKSQCLSPCTFLSLKISGIDTKKLQNRSLGQIKLFFEQEVPMIESYFLYDGFTFLAELGAYIGLFLGFAIFDISTVFDRIVDALDSMK